MKPNFALSLSFDGISLLQRSSPGWLSVGEVSLDAPDLRAALGQLRADAERLEQGQPLCKIVLPNDQIRYLTIPTGPLTEAARDAQVRAALDGATPYDLDELVYTYAIAGNETLIAAVARDTLDEAEDFAAQYGFDAVSFTAIPPAGAFRGEPDFGATRAAPRLLPPGDRPEVDALAIRVLGPARLPPPALPELEVPTRPLADAAPQDDEAPAPAFTSRRGAPAPDASRITTPPAGADATDAAPDSRPETPAAAPAAMDQSTANATAPSGVEAGVDAKVKSGGETAAQPAIEAGEDAPPAKASRRKGAAAQQPTLFDGADDGQSIAPKLDLAGAPASPAPTAPVLDEAQALAATIASLRPEKAEEPVAPPAAEDTVARGGLRGLFRRKATDTSDSKATKKAAGAGTPSAQSVAPAVAAKAPTPTAKPVKSKAKPDKAAPTRGKRAKDVVAEPAAPKGPSPALVALAASQRSRHGEAPLREAAKPDEATRATPTAPLTAPASAASASLGANRAPQRQVPQSEAERMTVFGARASTASVRRPRHMGLFLTLLLVLFLAGVAAWASLFSDPSLSALFRRTPDPAPTLAALPDPATVPDEGLSPEDLAEVESAPEPALPDEAELAAMTGETLSPAPIQQPPSLRAVPRDMAPAQVIAQDDAAAQANYAATGIWQQAPDQATPPPAAGLSDLYVASIDQGVPNLDAVAMPLAEDIDSDQRPATPLNPPPADTVFALDARGLVRATPDGALTPAGGRVYAGNPPLLPPARPAETQIAALVPGVPRTIGGVNLDAFRPRTRPGDLVERNERSELGGLSRTELAALRPTARPDLPPAREETEENAPGTEFAVGSSLFPRARPQDFQTRVAAAREAPVVPQTPIAPAVVPAPAAVAPAIPSSASVTRQATLENVIRLNQINLIGVYGQPSDRRALIRLSNGRYQKVQVGDTLDGGKVAAIGDDSLQYVKRGRNVVLRMPTEG